jgi:hypothetical protein
MKSNYQLCENVRATRLSAHESPGLKLLREIIKNMSYCVMPEPRLERDKFDGWELVVGIALPLIMSLETFAQ